MAKNKQQQQKKKERERRVAKEKLAEAAKRKTQEKATKETATPVSRTGKIMSKAAGSKPVQLPAGGKTNFVHRRASGPG